MVIKKHLFKVVFISAILSVWNIFSQTIWDMSPREVRNIINEKILSIHAEIPEVYSVNNFTITNSDRLTPLRIYSASDSEKLPIILLIHGGAWVAGNLETHDNMARYLCRDVKALVVSVEYMNSPEGKFPLPLELCYDALNWIVEHAQEWNGDVTRLAVVGDSAGGNMAATLCLMARDRKGPLIDLQVLINPSPDLTGNGTIQRQDDFLDRIRWYATQYVTDADHVNHPYVSPITAKDLTRLPAAVVILAEKDDLCVDGQKYAERLISAGISTKVYTQLGVGHLAGNGARASEEALESLDVAVAYLREVFLK